MCAEYSLNLVGSCATESVTKTVDSPLGELSAIRSLRNVKPIIWCKSFVLFQYFFKIWEINNSLNMKKKP